MDKLSVPEDLEIELPPGWTEHSSPGGPKEYWASSDGSRGLLQVSKFTDKHFEFISKQSDLGTFAAEIGIRLGSKDSNWGKPAGSKQGTCAFGRYGFSMFLEAEYPAMFLWVTVSTRAAVLWTWLGPDPKADEVQQASQVVMEARQTTGRTN